jgi:tripartite-type tricarboxylate transporter receptor subunit TctC
LSVEPDLPTMAEAGVAGVEVSSWSGFLVPAKTSREIVARLYDDTVKALADATVRDKLEATGAVVIGSTPVEFAAFLQAEHDKWGRIIKAAHIQAH